VTHRHAHHALVLGAGASLAAPAERPLFAAIRRALLAPLEIDLGDVPWGQLAPEALLSRLDASGLDIDRELRHMLSGGLANAIHAMAATVLASGAAVWTTNLDELIEMSAQRRKIAFHRLLSGDDAGCECELGHLVKVHGTLSRTPMIARSEDVLLPLPSSWRERLNADFRDATVAVIGYAGADVDLRAGLRDALTRTSSALWFTRPEDSDLLRRRFAAPLTSHDLQLRISERPDLAALAWGRAEGLTRGISPELWELARAPAIEPSPIAGYRPNDLLRARVLDDFGRGSAARKLYARASLTGPHRPRGARALYSSGLIHGARWRPGVLAALNLMCSTPLPWRWPHRQRLPYLTWNVAPDKRLRALNRSLRAVGYDPAIVLSAANAAKEVDPRWAVELGRRAQREAIARRAPASAAWATFTLSLALRWLGDIRAAAEQAALLADGFDALAGPGWVAWGHFESGAVAALVGDLIQARDQMQLAIDVFSAAGSMFSFDAWCAMIAIRRAGGDLAGQREAYAEARKLAGADQLRQRFKRDVLMVEEGEYARQRARFEEAAALYTELSRSPTVAQEVLGLLGLAEVQRATGEQPWAAWRALRRSDELGFGYGRVHAALTLGLAGQIDDDQAERYIAASVYKPPVLNDETGLRRYCQGSDPAKHILCFP
jgi:hypothetical protein